MSEKEKKKNPKISELPKMILFDVDGVFTDGSVYLNEKGEETLRFSRIDGKGIDLIRKSGFLLGVISAEDTEITKKRMSKLKMHEIHIGIKDKMAVYEKIKNKYKISDEEVCFCGDDIQDIPLLKKVGFSCCPSNSQEDVKEICRYVSEKEGGHGFVREICNLILKNEIKSKLKTD